MIFMPWPEIESFHNIRKYANAYPEILHGVSVVSYRCKVKLHGTNAAVQIHADGTIGCQSRESIISSEKDNAGFARWVMNKNGQWLAAIRSTCFAEDDGFIIYGEWCGPGIQKNVAVAEVPKKFFAVFAARRLSGDNNLIVEPQELKELTAGVSDTYVLPWYEESIDVDWNQSSEELTKTIAPINDWVLAIEANDPWVEATFGVKGTGEGLVFYPSSSSHLGWENYKNLVFKAKGDKHKNIKTAAPAQVNPEVAASTDAFCELVLTQARLEQGASKVAEGALTYDMKNLGKFIAWISADVQKETQDELEASGLTWKQIQKPLTDKAREWYKVKAK